MRGGALEPFVLYGQSIICTALFAQRQRVNVYFLTYLQLEASSR